MEGKTLRACFWFVLAGNALAVSTGAKVHEASPSNLHVSVFNDGQVAPGDLRKAEEVASAVFAHSGISLEWLNCGRPEETHEEQVTCSEVSFPIHLHVRILARSLNLKDSTFGISYEQENGVGCQADVFYAGVKSLGESRHTGPGGILGVVMAHELGHLLLGADSHTSVGLMRPLWNSDDLAAAGQGRLVFTEEQERQIRVRLDAATNLNDPNR